MPAWMARTASGHGFPERSMEERMKRTILALAAIVMASAAFAQGAPVASGTGPDKAGSIRMEAELYPLRVDVTRVYMHTQGFKVVYRKGQASFAEAYIPTSWFTPGGKAMLIQARGPQYPYMVVYYKPDGSFSHLKLYVLSNRKDASWGIIEGDPGDKFKVESVKIEF